MVEILYLESMEADLLLTWSDLGAGDWCQVELRRGHEQLQLDAEAKHIVFERLARGLSDDVGDATSQMSGVPVTWVLSLAERHSSISVTRTRDRRRVFVRGPSGAVVATFELSSDERKKWERELRSRI